MTKENLLALLEDKDVQQAIIDIIESNEYNKSYREAYLHT